MEDISEKVLFILLKKIIQISFQAQLYTNAHFFSERLCAYFPYSQEAKFYLAKSYYYREQYYATKEILINTNYEPSKYLLAQAYLKLQDFHSASTILETLEYPTDQINTITSESVVIPNKAIVLCLKGISYRKDNQIQKAIKCFKDSLELFPFLWTSYEYLCKLGAEVEAPSDIFNFAKVEDSSIMKQIVEIITRQAIKETIPITMKQALTVSSVLEEKAHNKNTNKIKKKTVVKTKKHVRESTNDSSKGNENETQDISKHCRDTVLNCIKQVLELLIILGSGYLELTQYRLKRSLKHFQKLTSEQFNTGNVLSWVALANFEMANYKEAENFFQKARKLEPYLLDNMEKYSIILWHLKKEVELSYLAHLLTIIDRKAPQTLCSVGNCFSLKQDHDSALKCFKRAIQVDPTFHYAYTLAGHEYLANEDLEKAENFFRQAIRLDARHYNAWYGLGYLFYRQEKYQLAEFHYRKAQKINQGNPLLICYIGMVFQKMNKNQEALTMYNLAQEVAKDNPLIRFRKAHCLTIMKRYKEALEQLLYLKDIIQECNVFFLMGKIYAKLGDTQNALLAYTQAQDYLKPKSSNMVKEAIDQVYEPQTADDIFASVSNDFKIFLDP
ncbi:TPR-like protein [Anaeromyces robustus]|uniref:TPR-like protein n=1 Tax=Anaeromyces robustus TaxID=1754192 RepID=A0A1Y1WJ48_9FUNG|nr:TPR-like protein [Anaeromyces robustus]|eukprot:ORX73513.1 TPR-like protein [Anaeromyces robustus]